jgi:hypothetical protein
MPYYLEIFQNKANIFTKIPAIAMASFKPDSKLPTTNMLVL